MFAFSGTSCNNPVNTIAVIRPYIATASQKMTDMRFFVFILGSATPALRILTAVVYIPLKLN